MLIRPIKLMLEDQEKIYKNVDKVYVVELTDLISYLEAHRESVEGDLVTAEYKLEKMIKALKQMGEMREKATAMSATQSP